MTRRTDHPSRPAYPPPLPEPFTRHPLPSFGVAVTSNRVSAAGLLHRLRRHDPPVIGRIDQDAVRLDVRTVLEGEDAAVCAAIVAALASEGEA